MKKFAMAALAVWTLFSATSASAQVLYDHLQCFKIRDAYNFHATVDLAGQPGNALGIEAEPGCTVMIKGQEFCMPVNKTIVKSDDPNALLADGQDLVPGFVCYKLKCPKRVPSTLHVGDQFGVRDVVTSVVTRICAPADW